MNVQHSHQLSNWLAAVLLTCCGCSTSKETAMLAAIEGGDDVDTTTSMCEVGQTRCVEQVLEQCSASGMFEELNRCQFACQAGLCVGECVPGELRCASDRVEQCNSAGEWLSEPACDAGCVDGTCLGENDAGMVTADESPQSTCGEECVTGPTMLKADVARLDAFFGANVAVSGNTTVVGAPGDSLTGGAYVFVLDLDSASSWRLQAILRPQADPGGPAAFGDGLAIWNDIIVVGAVYDGSGEFVEDDAMVPPSSGAAYVFVRDGESWQQEALLTPSNPDVGDMFGSSLGVHEDTIVVGAPDESSAAMGVDGDGADNSLASSGAAYVFRRTMDGWHQEAYLKASNTGLGDNFGWGAAVYGDRIVVGAPGEDSGAQVINGSQGDGDPNSLFDIGAAYVFVREDGRWSQEAYLKGSFSGLGNYQGNQVSIYGDTIAVGAHGESSAASGIDGGGSGLSSDHFASGAVYVYRWDEDEWRQEAFLKASYPDVKDNFGVTLSVFDDTLAVGAYHESSAATGIDGDQADNSSPRSGAAYVFTRQGRQWTEAAYLKATISDPDDRFGGRVAVGANFIIAGALAEDSLVTDGQPDPANNDAPWSGAAYVYSRH